MRFIDFAREAAPEDCGAVDAWGRNWAKRACPSQPAVQDLWVKRVEEVEGEEWVELRGCGFSGREGFWESICFCAACQYGYGAAGGILEQLARERGEDKTHPAVNVMLLWRRSVQYGLLQQMRQTTRAALCLRTAADLRYTGDRSSLQFHEARGVVDACSVAVPHTWELERLKQLERALPVYAVGAESMPGLADEMFRGYI
jgi:hypothetical protein